MSKRIYFIALAAALLLCLSACNENWEAPYASLQESGYNVSIRFDVNGGFFAGATDVAVVDVYSTAGGITNPDGTVSFWLLRPEDPSRAQGAFEATKNGCFLAGWYQQRMPRTDASGQPLDAYGVPCAESGREQGYTYSGRWDFDSMTFTVDPDALPEAGTAALTLYAAWIPYINYDIYAVNSDGSGDPVLLDTLQSVDLEIPVWNQRSGKLDMKNFPEREGYTFDAAYLSTDLETPLEQAIQGKGTYVDYDTGTLNAESVAIYTTWLEGSWFKIYNADQLSGSARLDANYILMEDLDFSDSIWPALFVKNEFNGTILGNGHSITGINAIQTDNSKFDGGLFGSLGSECAISDLTIDDACLTLEAGSRMNGACFGLLAGSISADASFSQVTVSGQLLISDSIYPQNNYTVGLLCASNTPDGIDYEISCAAVNPDSQVITVIDNGDGTVSINFVSP